MLAVVEMESATARQRLWIAAYLLGLASVTFLIAGLWSAYAYYQRDLCEATLGWWGAAPAQFWIAVILSTGFWVVVVLASRRFRGLALFCAGLAIGLWLMFGVWSTVEGHRLQQLYKLDSQIPSSAPLPEEALSTDPNRCIDVPT